MVCLWCGLTDGRRSRDYKSLPKFLRSIDNQFFYPWYAVLRFERFARERAPLILVINKKRKYPITISYPTTFNKSPTRLPPGSNIHKHFLHLFVLVPTTLYKKKFLSFFRRKSTPKGMFILLPLSVTHATSLITWG